MKKVLRTMALLAIVATAAFMTGCGDDDNNNNNNHSVVNAPAVATLQGKTFTLGDASTLTLSAAGSTYTYTPGGGAVTETGTYQYTPNGNTATIVTTPDGQGTPATYNLIFTGAANNQFSGSITRTPQGGNPSASTTFNTTGGTPPGGGGGETNAIIAPASLTGKHYLANGGTNGTVTISFPSGSTYTVAAGGVSIESGSYTYAGSTTTNTATVILTPTLPAGAAAHTLNLVFTGVTANAEAGTFTDSGTGAGTFTQTTSDGINPVGGTGTAPATLHSAHFRNILGPFPGADYTVTLSGDGHAGTFNSVFTDGGSSAGTGTYTYNASGSNATLVLTYGGDAAGDFDNLNLNFNSTTSGTFTGNQHTGNQDHNEATGTFDQVQP